MKEIITVNQEEKKMSSLEISELMGKKHMHVMRDIRALIDAEAVNESNFGLVDYKDAKGETRPMYLLDFEGTMILITGYDAKRRAAVVRRWHELEKKEQQPAFQIPSSLPEALRLAADLAEKNNKLSEKISTDRPKVEFATAIEDSKKSIKVGDFAKLLNNAGLKIGRNRMFEWLREKKYLMTNNEPYQTYIDNRWFSVIEKTRETDNGPVPYIQTMITGKGQISLTKKIIDYFNPIITFGEESRA